MHRQNAPRNIQPMHQMQTLLRTQKPFGRCDAIDPMFWVALTAPETGEVEDAAIQDLQGAGLAMCDLT